MRKNITYFVLVLSVASISLMSCNDDRLTALDPGKVPPVLGPDLKNPFKDVSVQFEAGTKVNTELKKLVVIDSTIKESKDPSEYNNFSKNRTFVSLGTGKLLDANGQEVDLPYKSKFMEIFKRRDMLLLDIPTQSNGMMLETSAVICWRVTKNGELLKPNPAKLPTILLRRPIEYKASSKVYYGGSKPLFDWEEGNGKDFKNIGKEVSGSLVEYVFAVFPGNLGYISVANPLDNTINLTQLYFISNLKPEAYKAYLVFDNFASFVRIDDGNVKNIPTGEKATLFVLSKSKTGQSYGLIKKIVTTPDLVIKQELAPISNTEINAFLNSIN